MKGTENVHTTSLANFPIQMFSDVFVVKLFYYFRGSWKTSQYVKVRKY